MQKKVNEKQYRAIGYYRLSKNDGQEHESDSIVNQRKLIHEYVKAHSNIELIDETYDDGFTGTNFDRPGFQYVLETAKSGKINCVIVKDLSRLGREYISMGKYLDTIFPALGVRFISVNDDIDSANFAMADDLIIPIKNVMNESYCRELSKKLRSQFRSQRKQGEFLGAFAVYGYNKSKDNKHKLVIDEYASEVVKSIFELKLQGYNQKAIADYLNAEQVLSPSEYKKSQGLSYRNGNGAKWNAAAITRILSNPVYIGTLTQGKRGTPNYKIKKMQMRPETDWIIVPNNHPIIIDPNVFEVVQTMLQRETRIVSSQNKVLPLSGVLFCADCGRSMIRRSVRRNKNVFYYYVCSGNKKEKICSSHSFAQKKLEEIVLHAIQNQISLIIELEQLAKNLGEPKINQSRLTQLSHQIEQQELELARCQNFRMKLYEALSDELIDREEYQNLREKYAKRIADTEQMILSLNEERIKIQDNKDMNLNWAEQYMKHQKIEELSH